MDDNLTYASSKEEVTVDEKRKASSPCEPHGEQRTILTVKEVLNTHLRLRLRDQQIGNEYSISDVKIWVKTSDKLWCPRCRKARTVIAIRFISQTEVTDDISTRVFREFRELCDPCEIIVAYVGYFHGKLVQCTIGDCINVACMFGM